MPQTGEDIDRRRKGDHTKGGGGRQTLHRGVEGKMSVQDIRSLMCTGHAHRRVLGSGKKGMAQVRWVLAGFVCPAGAQLCRLRSKKYSSLPDLPKDICSDQSALRAQDEVVTTCTARTDACRR